MPLGNKENDDNVRRAYDNAMSDDAQKTGFTRTEAFDPSPKARNPYTPSSGRMTGEADSDEVKRRASAGKVIDNSVLGGKR